MLRTSAASVCCKQSECVFSSPLGKALSILRSRGEKSEGRRSEGLVLLTMDNEDINALEGFNELKEGGAHSVAAASAAGGTEALKSSCQIIMMKTKGLSFRCFRSSSTKCSLMRKVPLYMDGHKLVDLRTWDGILTLMWYE